MTTGGKWRAFCLDFSRSSTRDFPTKNQLPNVLANARSDSLDQISQTKHSHENVWQLIFWCEGLEWTIAGQAPFTPCRHSCQLIVSQIEKIAKRHRGKESPREEFEITIVVVFIAAIRDRRCRDPHLHMWQYAQRDMSWRSIGRYIMVKEFLMMKKIEWEDDTFHKYKLVGMWDTPIQ